MDQSQEELEAAHLAVVSLLAVVTEEQLNAVETALEALAPMFAPARAALEHLRLTRGARRPLRVQDQEIRRALQAQLATLEKSR